MPRYRVLLGNGVVLDVRDPREHSELVAEWIAALGVTTQMEKASDRESEVGIDIPADEGVSFLTSMVTFRGEADPVTGAVTGAATMHSGPIIAIGVPEPLTMSGGTKSFEETVINIVRAFKETPQATSSSTLVVEGK